MDKTNKTNYEKPLGYLYKNKSQKTGKEYLSGIIDGKKVIIFSNNKKGPDSKHDYVVFIKKDLPFKNNSNKPLQKTVESIEEKQVTVVDDLL